MIGLAVEHGKHAMVFTRIADDKYCFLNPHREQDGQPDYVFLSETDILSRVGEESHIGYLEPLKESQDAEELIPSADTVDAALTETLSVLDQYKGRMTEFCQNLPSLTEILAIRDSLLRPIALEMPVMMGLIGETAVQSKLLLFQKQIFGLFRPEGGNDIKKPDLALLYEILEDYRRVVIEGQALVN
ncbi:MAG: hypothetical protein LUF30_06655 [Lachnospiraceae bacterium]|nr:hypothetical protein [Lachnospiraceae bacterium]